MRARALTTATQGTYKCAPRAGRASCVICHAREYSQAFYEDVLRRQVADARRRALCAEVDLYVGVKIWEVGYGLLICGGQEVVLDIIFSRKLLPSYGIVKREKREMSLV